MAEILCSKFEIPTPFEGRELKKILWINDSPSTARGAFDATLSESLENYDYIEIEYGFAASSLTKQTTIRTPILLSDGTFAFPNANNNLRGALCNVSAAGVVYIRRFTITNNTTIAFTSNNQAGGSESSTGANMPLKIYGIKILSTTRQIAFGTFSHPTSDTTVNIGFKPAYLCVRSGSDQKAISTYDATWSTTTAMYSGGSTSSTSYTMSGNNTNYRLNGITDTGFTINQSGSACTAHYFAIGEEE